MASNVIRRSFFSWAAPAGGVDVQLPTPGVASGAGTSIVIPFNEAMRAGPAFAQFSVTADGVTKAVSAAAVSGANLTLTVATIGGAGKAVVVTYTPGATASARLADNARGNEVPAGVIASYTS
jgi:uncharacterized repeat protein (TIGR02059 family)